MEEQHKEIEIRLQDLWLIFKHCWWQMLIVMVLVAALVFAGLTAVHEDEFTATTSIYVLRNSSNSVEEIQNPNLSTSDISIANSLIQDCNVLLRSHDHVLYPVLISENLQDVIDVKTLDSMLAISNKENTRVLYLSVTSSSAERSADIANALAEQACEYFNDLYDQEILNVVDRAIDPTIPSNPISMLMVLLIAFAMALVVYMIYFVLFIMDDKINGADDVERYLGLSMLGVIPNRQESGRKKSKYGYYYSHHDPNSQTRSK